MSRGQALRRIALRVVSTALLLVRASPARAEDHSQYKDSTLEDCADCHTSSGVAPNHGAFFIRQHRVLAAKPANNCTACHQQSFCLDCHQGGNVEPGGRVRANLSRRGEYMPNSHVPDFISTHPILAKAERRSCARCHDAATFCSDCHTRQIAQNRSGMSLRPHKPVFTSPGVPDPTWVSFHRTEARRDLRSCQGCHPRKSDCSNTACHSSLGGR